MISNGKEYQIINTTIPDILIDNTRNTITEIVVMKKLDGSIKKLSLIDNIWKDSKNNSFYFGHINHLSAITLISHKHYNPVCLYFLPPYTPSLARSYYLDIQNHIDDINFRFVPHQTYVQTDDRNLKLISYYSIRTNDKLIVFFFNKTYYHIRPQPYENRLIQKFGQFGDLDDVFTSNVNNDSRKPLQFSVSIYKGNIDTLLEYSRQDPRLRSDMVLSANVL
jgi:hypothetical protein